MLPFCGRIRRVETIRNHIACDKMSRKDMLSPLFQILVSRDHSARGQKETGPYGAPSFRTYLASLAVESIMMLPGRISSPLGSLDSALTTYVSLIGSRKHTPAVSLASIFAEY